MHWHMLEIIGFGDQWDDPAGQEKEYSLIESFNLGKGEVLRVRLRHLFASAVAYFSVVNFIWLGAFFFSRLDLAGIVII